MNRIVFVGGVWDLLHPGHLRFLKMAQQLGDELHVGVLTDEAVEEYKPPAVMTFSERFSVMCGLSIPRDVWTLQHSDATEVLKRLGALPSCAGVILAHGTDWTPGWEIGQTWIQDQGYPFVLLPYTEGISSTIIKDRILQRVGG